MQAKEQQMIAEAPFWENRPQILQDAIDATFASSQSTSKESRGYILRGSVDYSFFSGAVSAAEIVDAKTKPLGVMSFFKGTKPIRLLDVGAGIPKFLAAQVGKHPKLEADAVSMHDYRDQGVPEHRERITYHVTNAENIADIPEELPPESFDVVVSSMTFWHFKDPLGTMAQVYSLLKEGGVLVANQIEPLGIEEALPAIIDDLRANGVQVYAEFAYTIIGERLVATKINSLILKKGKGNKNLSLPVAYTDRIDDQGRTQYLTTKSFENMAPKLPAEVLEYMAAEREIYTGSRELQPSKQMKEYRGRFREILLKDLRNEAEIQISADYFHKSRSEFPVNQEVFDHLERLFVAALHAWQKEFRNQDKIRKEIREVIEIDLPTRRK